MVHSYAPDGYMHEIMLKDLLHVKDFQDEDLFKVTPSRVNLPKPNLDQKIEANITLNSDSIQNPASTLWEKYNTVAKPKQWAEWR